VKNQKLKARPAVIRKNIERLWGTIAGAERATGFTRQTFYNIIAAGEVTERMVGRLYKLGINPAELIR